MGRRTEKNYPLLNWARHWSWTAFDPGVFPETKNSPFKLMMNWCLNKCPIWLDNDLKVVQPSLAYVQLLCTSPSDNYRKPVTFSCSEIHLEVMHFHHAECVSKQKEHLSVTHYKYNNAKATKSSFFDSCQKTQIRNGLNRHRGILGIGQVAIHKTV